MRFSSLSGWAKTAWISSSLNAYFAAAMKRRWRKLWFANSVGRLGRCRSASWQRWWRKHSPGAEVHPSMFWRCLESCIWSWTECSGHWTFWPFCRRLFGLSRGTRSSRATRLVRAWRWRHRHSRRLLLPLDASCNRIGQYITMPVRSFTGRALPLNSNSASGRPLKTLICPSMLGVDWRVTSYTGSLWWWCDKN